MTEFPTQRIDELRPGGGESIAGVVTDFEGVPLGGVHVEVATQGGSAVDLERVVTDADGSFTVEGLAPGRYDLRFLAGPTKARSLAVPTGTTRLEVRLARPAGILLQVRTEAGRPDPGMLHVVLQRETPGGPVCEHLGRTVRPRVMLWNLKPGRYTVTVWGGPYLPVVGRGVEVADHVGAPTVEVVLRAEGGSVVGRVRRGEAPVVEALVGWRRLDQPGPWPRAETSTLADAEGRFAIRGLPTGRYRVFAGATVGPIGEVEVLVFEGQTSETEVRLPA